MDSDRKRKIIFLAIIGALVFPGLFAIHDTWNVKPEDEEEPTENG